LGVRIHAIHAESDKRYGSPRIHAELKAQGMSVNHKRVERIMRQEGIRVTTRQRFVVTTGFAPILVEVVE
jgi:transposase InsO family protein